MYFAYLIKIILALFLSLCKNALYIKFVILYVIFIIIIIII